MQADRTVAVKKIFPKLFKVHLSCSIGMVKDVKDELYENNRSHRMCSLLSHHSHCSHLSLHCHLNVHSIVMFCTKCTN